MEVTVVGLYPDVYHTDPDCSKLASSSRHHNESISDLDEGVRECSYCAGTPPINVPGRRPEDLVKDLANTTCLSCGADVEPGEECSFCRVFEEVIGE